MGARKKFITQASLKKIFIKEFYYNIIPPCIFLDTTTFLFFPLICMLADPLNQDWIFAHDWIKAQLIKQYYMGCILRGSSNSGNNCKYSRLFP